ncbi:PREDICTED: sodium- and chloride-dependent GABA transporter 1-like [Acropora digitifera]|uniref:sodium- and chloride-dependent GABA transporter 1-like n=1 Tax=Acropora digitifera TaxID=70779 RepID=UPI00077AFB76|nr:PREDICTED: sodium- and chloride-dependent GABA transporter 1-like [Acropora digitifera]
MSNKVHSVAISLRDSNNSEEREKWTSKTDFIMSCIGYAVGLGNLWRFPYLCYKNGGATFLIPYFLTLATCGIPLFYLELALGQYLSLGTIKAWPVICPVLKGLGVAMVITSFFISVYYNVVIAWSLLYLYHSFASEVPWKSCGNGWNTAFCSEAWGNITSKCDAFGQPSNCTIKLTSPSEEFWERYILTVSSGIDEPGEIRLPLAASLLVAWIAVYFCLYKGIKSSGKVAYFTATFPYIVLLALLVRGTTLPGAVDGIIFYLKPDFSKLLEAELENLNVPFFFFVLLSADRQYTDFNCYLVGPGLGFVAYPEGIAQMPGASVWAVLFFFMLFNIGLGSQFVFTETTMTGLMESFSKCRSRKGLTLLVLCAVSYLIGLSCVTKGGIYVLNLFDSHSGGLSLVLVVIFEAVAVSWGYGVEKFCGNIYLMIGKRPNAYFRICWKYITPAVGTLILLGSLAQWKKCTYGGYVYPGWVQAVAWMLTLCCFVTVPIGAIAQIFLPKGSFRERLKKAVSPDVSVLNEVFERHNLKPKSTCAETKTNIDPV